VSGVDIRSYACEGCARASWVLVIQTLLASLSRSHNDGVMLTVWCGWTRRALRSPGCDCPCRPAQCALWESDWLLTAGCWPGHGGTAGAARWLLLCSAGGLVGTVFIDQAERRTVITWQRV